MFKLKRKNICKGIVRRMTGVSLIVSVSNNSTSFRSQHLYREAVVEYREGELRLYGRDAMSWDSVSINQIADIKEFDNIKRYELTLTDGVDVILEEYFY